MLFVGENVLERPEGRGRRLNAPVNVGLRSERAMDDRAEIFEFLSEVDKACDRPIDIEDIETRSIRNRVFNPWRREVHCLGLGQDAPVANVHEQAELAKMIEEVTSTSEKVRSSVEEKSAIVSEERKPELKGCCTTLALRLLKSSQVKLLIPLMRFAFCKEQTAQAKRNAFLHEYGVFFCCSSDFRRLG